MREGKKNRTEDITRNDGKLAKKAQGIDSTLLYNPGY